MQKTLIAILPFIACIWACGMDEQSARSRCHDYQVGKYYYDTLKNVHHSAVADSLADTFIELNADSSFSSNITCSILPDSVGRWEAGTCGIDGIGSFRFQNTPLGIQFSPRYKGTNEIAIIGKGHGAEKRHYYWYKRK